MTISAPATAAGTSVFTKGYISYQLSGVSPNQVFTIQWRRYGRWSNSSTGLNDYLNTQIKLYQTTNIIEVIYGNCGTNSLNSFTGEIGLRGTTNADFNNRSIVAPGAYNASTAGETRSFDAVKGITFSLRSKENANDYRYFPEPDLQPVFITQEYINKVKANLPTLPDELFNLYTKTYKLVEYDALQLIDLKEVAEGLGGN